MFTRWGWHCIGVWFYVCVCVCVCCVCVCVCGHARACMPCNNTQYSLEPIGSVSDVRCTVITIQLWGVWCSDTVYFVCLCMCSCGAVIFPSSYQVVTWYIYLLTAVGFPPSGSSTVHIYTQTIHRTTQNKQYIEQRKNLGRVRAVPCLCGLYPGIFLTTEEKAWKNFSQGSWRCQLTQWILWKCCDFGVRVW